VNTTRPETVQCRLVAGHDVDSTTLIESPPGTIDSVQPAALIVWTQFGSGGGGSR